MSNPPPYLIASSRLTEPNSSNNKSNFLMYLEQFKMVVSHGMDRR